VVQLLQVRRPTKGNQKSQTGEYLLVDPSLKILVVVERAFFSKFGFYWFARCALHRLLSGAALEPTSKPATTWLVLYS